jgi:hypothetical protein
VATQEAGKSALVLAALRASGVHPPGQRRYRCDQGKDAANLLCGAAESVRVICYHDLRHGDHVVDWLDARDDDVQPYLSAALVPKKTPAARKGRHC